MDPRGGDYGSMLACKPKEEPANIHSVKEPMLSSENVECLEAVFHTVRYPSDSVIEYLADDLVVPMASIKVFSLFSLNVILFVTFQDLYCKHSVIHVMLCFLQTWFRKKRGDGKKLHRLVEPPMLKLEYSPHFGLTEMGLVPDEEIPCNDKDSSISDVQQKLDNLNFEDQEVKSISDKSQPINENAVFIHDILGSLIQLCPGPPEEDQRFRILQNF